MGAPRRRRGPGAARIPPSSEAARRRRLSLPLHGRVPDAQSITRIGCVYAPKTLTIKVEDGALVQFQFAAAAWGPRGSHSTARAAGWAEPSRTRVRDLRGESDPASFGTMFSSPGIGRACRAAAGAGPCGQDVEDKPGLLQTSTPGASTGMHSQFWARADGRGRGGAQPRPHPGMHESARKGGAPWQLRLISTRTRTAVIACGSGRSPRPPAPRNFARTLLGIAATSFCFCFSER